MQDQIKSELILPADPQTVWEKSFGSADALATWFLPIKEGTYKPGETLTFDCGETVAQARILTVNPPNKFAWQGHPGGPHKLTDYPESEMTTTTFQLEPHPEGTKLTVIESGFSNIPEPRRAFAHQDNSNGWEIVLPMIAKTYQK
jgi:uncharacterized protein YndB with AHSA1/START domain